MKKFIEKHFNHVIAAFIVVISIFGCIAIIAGAIITLHYTKKAQEIKTWNTKPPTINLIIEKSPKK